MQVIQGSQDVNCRVERAKNKAGIVDRVNPFTLLYLMKQLLLQGKKSARVKCLWDILGCKINVFLYFKSFQDLYYDSGLYDVEYEDIVCSIF